MPREGALPPPWPGFLLPPPATVAPGSLHVSFPSSLMSFSPPNDLQVGKIAQRDELVVRQRDRASSMSLSCLYGISSASAPRSGNKGENLLTAFFSSTVLCFLPTHTTVV